jgi:hypothetical protein
VNKVFEAIGHKLDAIRQNARTLRVVLLLAPTPHAKAYTNLTGVHSAFLPYAASELFGQHVNSTRKYRFDIGFTGGVTRFSSRYPFRAKLFGDPSTATLKRFRREKVRAFLGSGYRPQETYIRVLETTRIWLATSESGDHVSTRAFDVMMSGRSMLLCDRNLAAFGALGIVEGEHAAMFNSTVEFEDKARAPMVHTTNAPIIVR